MDALDRAIERAGGVGKLATSIGAGQSQVSNWRKRGTVLDAIYCTRIERLYGVSRQELRPQDWADVWPELAATTEVAANG